MRRLIPWIVVVVAAGGVTGCWQAAAAHAAYNRAEGKPGLLQRMSNDLNNNNEQGDLQ